MKKLVLALCCVTGLLGTPSARAFVMIGPMDVAEVSSGGIDFNYTDDLGGPKAVSYTHLTLPTIYSV